MDAQPGKTSPPFRVLRKLDIKSWVALHYAAAALIMFLAEPSVVMAEIERVSHHVIDTSIVGVVYAICSAVLLLDRQITPNKFRLYLLPWMAYVIAAVAVAIRALLTDEVIPGIYLATLSYVGEMVFMAISYSAYVNTWNVAGYIAEREPTWMRLLNLTRTDIKGIERDKQ